MIKDDPEAWVTYVTQMYLKGNARIRSLEVKPSNDCRNAKPTGIKPVNRPTMAGGTFSTANHWAALTGGDSVKGGLNLWTWGKTKNMMGFDTGKIVSNFHGYVAVAPHRGS